MTMLGTYLMLSRVGYWGFGGIASIWVCLLHGALKVGGVGDWVGDSDSDRGRDEHFALRTAPTSFLALALPLALALLLLLST